MPGGEALRLGDARPFEIGKLRLERGRPHIGPHHVASLYAGISLDLELAQEIALLHLARLRDTGDVDAIAVDVEFESMIDAAQASFLVAAEEHRGGAVRAALVDEPDASARIAEEDEILA